ncbi:oxygen-dependent tRNA uridine(34) hydroxylase TrhO [Sphingobium sp. CAP-1]|uniref:oxygen-dependent tRNA uridine(34) hydroxylase TrhO n=1 Tax=Sphingobium sp. CAP-1 TaxID=2676077 RepID=UPI0012BB2B76|nr:rhodanese-related sulfurtransferase [Sphingobium sp. CAP-1]QGP79629.1 rhodanese-related sulfurtransferase [Sphingobium sp. CAP-1]
MAYIVAALYRFTRFADPAAIAADLRTLCTELGTCGTLILAGEGINGTVAGSAEAIDTLIAHLRALPGCADMDVKYAQAGQAPFARMKVKVKAEIVTLGAGDLDPANAAGTHLDPTAWNDLIADPDTILIDTRNAYEVACGTFDRAIDPATRSFRDFPDWFDAFAADLKAQGRRPKIAMFCTGGIRCEKSTALVKARGFDDVYHLKGGILRYLEEMPQADSRWQGECYVFDERVTVGHGLKPGDYTTCRACGLPHPRDAAHDCAGDDSGVWPHRG